MTQQDDQIVALEVLLSSKHAADGCLDPERREHLRGSGQSDHFLRDTVEHHAQTRGSDHAQMEKRLVPLAPGNEIRRRDDVAGPVPSRVVLPDCDDAIGVAIGEGLEDHAAHDGEDRRGGANAERQCEDGRDGKAWGPEKRANREAEVLKEGFSHT